ncbi:hypothetical protein IQ07DRAFT_592406 [Pyrenochaeta sp. DS3sAY3a]|nr:hypothetical protein IQ07DRAFT_592406 [Pyrenochaeta sp. DS3sAY3a]
MLLQSPKATANAPAEEPKPQRGRPEDVACLAFSAHHFFWKWLFKASECQHSLM